MKVTRRRLAWVLGGEALAALEGKAAIYHCVSRVVNREFVLKREEQTARRPVP